MHILYFPFFYVFFQFEDAIHYDDIMGHGYAKKTFELDFGGSSSNEAKFSLEVTQEGVTQEDAPDTIGTNFHFSSQFDT